MYTLLLEITTLTRSVFYNPAVDTCKSHPRTKDGVARAFKKFQKFCIERADQITGARVVMYEGKYEYWKHDMQPVCTETIF